MTWPASRRDPHEAPRPAGRPRPGSEHLRLSHVMQPALERLLFLVRSATCQAAAHGRLAGAAPYGVRGPPSGSSSGTRTMAGPPSAARWRRSEAITGLTAAWPARL